MKNEFLILLLCIIAQLLIAQPLGTTMNVKGAPLHLRCSNYSSASGESTYDAPSGFAILSYEVIDITPKVGDCTVKVETVQGPSIGYIKEYANTKYRGLLEIIAKAGNSEPVEAFEGKVKAEYRELQNRISSFFNTHSRIKIVGYTQGRPLRTGGKLDVQANIVIIKILTTDEIDNRIKLLSEQFGNIVKN